MKNRIKNSYSKPFSFKMSLRDWRQALNSAPAYRLSNGTIRSQTKFVTLITSLGILLLFFTYREYDGNMTTVIDIKPKLNHYNHTYPLSAPKFVRSGIEYKIGIIADLDKQSKRNHNVWVSYYLKGSLIWNSVDETVSVYWDKVPATLKSKFSQGGRGMELSELIVFDGRLLTFDDHTGLVYEINDDSVIPWVILIDGNGHVNKGFKCEWAAVKDDCLYVGSMGKEWTTSKGIYVNHNPMWVKVVHPNGEVRHMDWKDNYIKLRKAIDIDFPGYMIHESALWSSIHRKWFFLPRRSSSSGYDEDEDELRGTNILLMADENFNNIVVRRIGDITPVRGFSSFKFIPSTNDNVITALKSEEFNGTSATFITAFTIDGAVLLPETKISNLKYEGLEFI